MAASADRILLYCRAGFEGECAHEILDRALELGLAGYVRAERDSAYVEFVESEPGAAARLHRQLRLGQLIFARQWLLALPALSNLDPQDRVSPILEGFRQLGERLGHLWVESPDTNGGKELATFCKKFTAPLAQALRREGLLAPSREPQPDLPWGHVFFLDSRRALVGLSRPGNRSPDHNGIMRLKFPVEAPSRSTLKLDEAILTLLSEEERLRWLTPGSKVVDLGAAPGGWTWQMVRRGLFVTAVDNGPMDVALMDTGQVTHRREDGFRHQPRQQVAWMLCDMVEKPHRVADLMADWLVKGWCQRTIFNLKLPMKKRYEELCSCLARIERRLRAAGLEYDLRAKQLYHDREEVTVFIGVRPVR